nr:hypothetical protein [Micromonospora sp. DSM 115978]
MTATDTVKPTDTTTPADPQQADTLDRHTVAPRWNWKARGEQITLGLIIAIPLGALVAAVPLLWGRWITWRDVVIAVAMYAITGHGVTVGFHRYFTHRGFKTSRPVRIA